MSKKILIKKQRIDDEPMVIFDGKKAKIIVDADLKDILQFLDELGYEKIEYEGFKDQEIPKRKPISLKSILKRVKSKCNECGAIGIYVGFVKGMNRGKKVLKLEFEKTRNNYDNKIKEIEKKLLNYPGVVKAFVYHNTGVLRPGDDIMYIVVMCKHRKDVWKPLKVGVELAKTSLPLKMIETYENGEVRIVTH